MVKIRKVQKSVILPQVDPSNNQGQLPMYSLPFNIRIKFLFKLRECTLGKMQNVNICIKITHIQMYVVLRQVSVNGIYL